MKLSRFSQCKHREQTRSSNCMLNNTGFFFGELKAKGLSEESGECLCFVAFKLSELLDNVCPVEAILNKFSDVVLAELVC